MLNVQRKFNTRFPSQRGLAHCSNYVYTDEWKGMSEKLSLANSAKFEAQVREVVN